MEKTRAWEDMSFDELMDTELICFIVEKDGKFYSVVPLSSSCSQTRGSEADHTEPFGGE